MRALFTAPETSTMALRGARRNGGLVWLGLLVFKDRSHSFPACSQWIKENVFAGYPYDFPSYQDIRQCLQDALDLGFLDVYKVEGLYYARIKSVRGLKNIGKIEWPGATDSGLSYDDASSILSDNHDEGPPVTSGFMTVESHEVMAWWVHYQKLSHPEKYTFITNKVFREQTVHARKISKCCKRSHVVHAIHILVKQQEDWSVSDLWNHLKKKSNYYDHATFKTRPDYMSLERRDIVKKALDDHG